MIEQWLSPICAWLGLPLVVLLLCVLLVIWFVKES